jgi:hypothetical protein
MPPKTIATWTTSQFETRAKKSTNFQTLQLIMKTVLPSERELLNKRENSEKQTPKHGRENL